MRKSTRAALRIAILAVLLPAAGCSHLRRGGDPSAALRARIEEVLTRPELRGSTAGIEVRRLGDGALLYERGAELLLPPASTAKLVTCASALALLGKDFRFETRVVQKGKLAGGVLEGDLMMVASGDPNLSQRVGPGEELLFVDNDHTYAGFLNDAELVPGDPLEVLADLASQVRRSGVERIEGSVVVDDGLFVEKGEELLENLSASCVNDNSVDVMVTPAGEAGKPPSVAVQPINVQIVVENQARTVKSTESGEARLSLTYLGGVGRFKLSGSIPLGARPTLCVGKLRDPALAAAHLLAGELAKRGIEARDPPRRATAGPAAYSRLPCLARHVSPPLSEAVKVILKVSHNLHAEMLPEVIGARLGKAGNRSAGFRLIHDFLEKEGIDADQVMLQSGSGLGRSDCLSARFLVSLLRKAVGWEGGAELFAALPISGVDGTLSTRLRKPTLRGRVRAKTGTLVYPGALNRGWIYLSKSLAGYLEIGDPPPAADGDSRASLRLPGKDALAFAILISNTFARSRREGAEALFHAQEDIIEAVLDAYGAGD